MHCTGQREQCSPRGCPLSERNKGRNFFRAWLSRAEEVPSGATGLTLSSSNHIRTRLKKWSSAAIFGISPPVQANRSYLLGGNKGLELITSSRTQILIGVPTYTMVSPNGPPAGFGDLPLMLKFRISSAERREGNYLLTFLLAATAPTGSRQPWG